MAKVKGKPGETDPVGIPGVTGVVEDVVNHPNHYTPNGVDSFMHMKDQMGKTAFDGFLQGNAIKYVQRYAFKGKPTEDLCKAAFYLFHLAFETTDGSLEEVRKVLDRMITTLRHAGKHYISEFPFEVIATHTTNMTASQYDEVRTR